ncbi:T6SS effector phospholipase Tle3 domain-containing protein [Proteus terrae]|uniref:T6SS effector phospholipase Tle3 domain-containing protein n=1 Tax=Proteus terrae TaxID=1574161 RepID=UPI003F6E9501
MSKQHGIFYWNGGPFQNGTNQLFSLWSEYGFSGSVAAFIDLQWFNPESDRLLTDSPPRNYYAHAVERLSKLIAMIRKYNSHDTISVISHSQGTMIALAAAAIEAPDALFVLNSPYALHDYKLNAVSYPLSEQISAEQREATLQAIINKVAENKDKLKNHPCGYKGLVVGLNEEGKSWSPKDKIRKVNDNNTTSQDGSLKLTENKFIQERDNHGRTYIYCNPHDRVMGASPLRSIGWNGIPNIFNCKTKQYSFSPFFTSQEECTLYVRILGRNMPCGGPPDSPTDANKSTIFCDHKSQYCDGTSFWENNTKPKHYLTWPKPDKNTKIYINGPEVPNPIQSNEMLEFDETYTNGITDFKVASENKGLYGYGFGQVHPKKNQPIDADYYYLIDFYDYDRIQVSLTNEEKKARGDDPNLHAGEKNDTLRFETLKESRDRFRTYIQRGTDHSSLPKDEKFLKRVVAYDLPIGYCEIGKSPEKMNELRKFADWQSGSDDYMKSGKLPPFDMPDIIKNPLNKK